MREDAATQQADSTSVDLPLVVGDPEKAPRSLLFVGWMFTVLSSPIGIGIAAIIALAKVTTPGGSRVCRYDWPSRSQSHAMLAAWPMTFLLWFTVGLVLRQFWF